MIEIKFSGTREEINAEMHNMLGYPIPRNEPVAAEPVAAEPVAAEPVAAEPVAAEPVAAKPKRKRRTKAQIEADKIAEDEACADETVDSEKTDPAEEARCIIDEIQTTRGHNDLLKVRDVIAHYLDEQANDRDETYDRVSVKLLDKSYLERAIPDLKEILSNG